MASKNILITGITDLLVLSVLDQKGASYAYEIQKYLADHSGHLLSLSQNTIYTVIYKLEAEQMIVGQSKLVGKKRTRIYYSLEESGRAYLKELTETYQSMTKGVANIMDALAQETPSAEEDQ